MIDQVKSTIAHMKWANERMVRALSASTPAPADAVRWLAHILAAERVWLARLNREDNAGISLWPELDAAGCAALAEENASSFARLAGTLDDSALQQDVVYRNSTGTEFHTSTADILTHVSMHGAYHRGQINTALRNAGYEPINVDYITYVRER